nr:hypothetical protein [Nannocystis sp.]
MEAAAEQHPRRLDLHLRGLGEPAGDQLGVGVAGTFAAGAHRELGREGLGQALGRARLEVAEWAEALEQHQSAHAIGPGAGEQGGHAGAERVAHEVEGPPPERLGDGAEVGDVVDEGVGRADAATGQAVAGEVEGDDAAAGQQRREVVVGGGVVEPAVQGEHGDAVLGPVDAGGQRQAGDLDRALDDGHAAVLADLPRRRNANAAVCVHRCAARRRGLGRRAALAHAARDQGRPGTQRTWR